ncbi:ABC transporter ATP-binding protein [Mycoplasmopsis gallopavonis]|uniref:ABC-type multidrug/protein/lipid transport system ATPase component n=1 Tax=Mycoplasmopsis gallopavonis TaxID=76629 RepID=A0A449B0I2_9BACT|nr:ABC transporter ATP-binding protein [Mycoplasmopsis gallopavonis]RIV16770.1 ABC transporter ATP-binding protein [Mycoplasmopsis gallopavonis]VEU73265.1 ABC-type multidrug/protein/lipid transport system ATPase component [Mycoplasmopsis gallopavonis]
MLKIFKILPKTTKFRILLCALIAIFPSFLEMIIPQFVKQFIEISGSTPNTVHTIKILSWELQTPSGLTPFSFLIILVIVFTTLQWIIWICSLRLGEYTISHIRHLIRMKLFEKILNLSKDNIDQISFSTIITRFNNDIMKINGGFYTLCFSLLNGSFLIIWGTVFSVILSLYLSISILILVPLIFLGALFAIKFLFPYYSKENTILDKFNLSIQQDINGIELIKSYNLQSCRYDIFDSKNSNLLNTNLKVSKISSIAWPIIHFSISIANVSVFVIFGLIAHNYSNINIARQVSNVYQFIAYLGLISSGVFQVCFEANKLIRSNVSSKRVYEILTTESSIQPISNNNQISDGAIEFQNVSYAYHDNPKHQVLKNISFKIPAHSTVGIIGTTGSGKSSLVNILTREVLPTSGRVLIDNIDINQINSEDFHAQISAVWQKNMLLSGTIKENLNFTNKQASDSEIEQTLKIAQAHFVNEYPDKTETKIGQNGINLSGGQRQRISIAQAILKKPKILILDDSTSALDNTTDKLVRKGILNKLENTTLIIIAQRIKTIKDMDQIIILDNGQIVGTGTHEQLLANNEYYQKIYNSQEKK